MARAAKVGTLLRAALRHTASSGASPLQPAAQQVQAAAVLVLARWLHAASRQAPALQGGSIWQQPFWQRRYGQEAAADAATDDSELTEARYHKLADQTLEDLLERVEVYVESLDLDDSDVEYSQGVLTVRLGPLGTYVINKQGPNRQIWMSSPLSGPSRYDFDPQKGGRWVYRRDGHDLHSRLADEFKQLTGEELELSPCFSCGKLNVCSGEQCEG